MISIVISSYQPQYYEALLQNIKNTIGAVGYEVIKIDNPGVMGICEAYNRGVRAAQYPYLCFVHEDILFKTQNWGLNFLSHLKDSDVGAIGVAGSAYKSAIPSSWSFYHPYTAVNIIQGYKSKQKAPEHICSHPGGLNNTCEVVVLDGVFIGTHKYLWEQHPFDTVVFKGFHGYDTDFSLQLVQQNKLFVVFDILLEHFSEGNPNREWMEAAMAVSDKWRGKLPVDCIPDLTKAEQLSINLKVKAHFKKRLKQFGYNAISRKLLSLKYT